MTSTVDKKQEYPKITGYYKKFDDFKHKAKPDNHLKLLYFILIALIVLTALASWVGFELLKGLIS